MEIFEHYENNTKIEEQTQIKTKQDVMVKILKQYNKYNMIIRRPKC